MHNSSDHWNPQAYARNARFVADLGEPVLELLAPKPGEQVLDLGCGDGALTQKLVSFGCRAVAVDGSPRQVEAARNRGLDARIADGERLEFVAEFDAVFSNAALHWMRDAGAVIAGVWRALKPGGRFVAEFGGAGNVACILGAISTSLRRRGIDSASINPWYFPTLAEYKQRLESQGFRVHFIELFPRPTPLPGDISAWLEIFAPSFFSVLAPSEHPIFTQEVRDQLRSKLCDATGVWVVDYVRLRFSAEKPGSRRNA